MDPRARPPRSNGPIDSHRWSTATGRWPGPRCRSSARTRSRRPGSWPFRAPGRPPRALAPAPPRRRRSAPGRCLCLCSHGRSQSRLHGGRPGRASPRSAACREPSPAGTASRRWRRLEAKATRRGSEKPHAHPPRKPRMRRSSARAAGWCRGPSSRRGRQ